MTSKISKVDAQNVLAVVERQFAQWISHGYGPVLVKRGPNRWSIVWEDGAPYAWTIAAGPAGGTDDASGIQILPVEYAGDLWTEPVNGVELAILRG